MELKTEGRSRRSAQDRYLEAARDAGLPALLEGVLDIFRATNAKRKYFHLLEMLERLGLLDIPGCIPEEIRQGMFKETIACSRAVKITSRVSECVIVYVQPRGTGPDIISFNDFRRVVERRDDPVSKRFAKSLAEWARVEAGQGVGGSGAPS